MLVTLAPIFVPLLHDTGHSAGKAGGSFILNINFILVEFISARSCLLSLSMQQLRDRPFNLRLPHWDRGKKIDRSIRLQQNMNTGDGCRFSQ